jgi:peptidoglycan hydrolase CwlO-like protein
MPRLLSLLILAGFFVASSAAQSSNPGSPPPAAPAMSPAPPAESKKTKKVWTNDNLSDANGAVSVVGNSKPASNTKLHPAKPADAQYIASVRKQLDKLNGQLTDTDKQIADLTNFSKGEPPTSASGMKVGKGYNRDPIDVQIHALQEKKKDLQSRIDALLDEARKKGVEPGQLR